jgi:hypothetical protein
MNGPQPELTPISSRYLVTSGTCLGREHARLGKNNQDGIGIFADPEVIAAVVTDGCSEGAASEVGAKLAAHWLASWAPLYARATGFVASRFVPALVRGLVRHLEPFVRGMSSLPGIDPLVVREHFLFTFLMALVRRDRTTVFGLGDGLFSVDGKTTILDPGPDNAPAYAAYRLVGIGGAEDPVLHLDVETATYESLVLGTDGAAKLCLDGLVTDDRLLDNPSLLHKRLAARGTRERLYDDTTVVLIRRRPCTS